MTLHRCFNIPVISLTFCNFHLFAPIKNKLVGTHFATNDDVKHAVCTWLKWLFAAGIGAMTKQKDKGILWGITSKNKH